MSRVLEAIREHPALLVALPAGALILSACSGPDVHVTADKAPAHAAAPATPTKTPSETPSASPTPEAAPDPSDLAVEEIRAYIAQADETLDTRQTAMDDLSLMALNAPSAEAAINTLYSTKYAFEDTSSADPATDAAKALVLDGFRDVTYAFSGQETREHVPAGAIVIDRDTPTFSMFISLGSHSEFSVEGRSALADGVSMDDYQSRITSQAPYILLPKAIAEHDPATPTATPSPSAIPSKAPKATPAPTKTPAVKPVVPTPAKPEKPAKHTTAEQRWLAEVALRVRHAKAHIRHASAGIAPDSHGHYVSYKDGKRLAINLDIDDTSLESTYHYGLGVRSILSIARYASSQHVLVAFNTGRLGSESGYNRTVNQLKWAAGPSDPGFPVDYLCMHRKGVPLAANKQGCRNLIRRWGDPNAAETVRIIANFGNHDTDFVKAGSSDTWGRSYKLPGTWEGRKLQ